MAEISPVGFDATIRHATYLERLKAEQVRQITPMLRQIDEKLRARLSKGELTTFGRARLERLLESIDKQLKGILDEYGWGLSKELTALAKVEAAFEASSLAESVKNPRFEATVPAPAKIVAAAMASPLGVKGIHGGKLLKGFIKGWSDAQRDTLTGIIRTGSVSGQTNAEIIRAIRGDARLGFRNGALAQTRNQTAAMTRTAVQHISHQARLATLQANSRVVKKYRWLSTLDDRTSELCQGLSGEEFEVGNGPIPPAHVNCRSTIVAVLEGELAEELRKGRKQASQFGPVDAKENYFDWMKRQPAAFQDDALGPVKARLLRRGGLSGEEFRQLTRADNFRPLTLAEMAKKNPLAFEKAGIRITPSGRAVIEGSRIATIKANLPPPPKPTPPPTTSKKGSITNPNEPAKRQEWTKEWREKDTFKSPRLAQLVDRVDDPGYYEPQPRGAYYQPANQSIHMGTAKVAADHAGRATLRHEWGHYLDDVLGRLAITSGGGGKFGEIVRKVAGAPIDSVTSRFISGWNKPIKALEADAKKIKGLGKRIYKQVFPESKNRVFNHGMIERAWQERANQIRAMSADELPLKAARKELADSDSIVARVYRRIKSEGLSFSMADDVLWAEASAAGDLSILLANQGRSLWWTLKKFSPDGAGNFGKFSDLLGAITKTEVGDYAMGWGHGKAYYATEKVGKFVTRSGLHAQATESFANFTALEKLRRNDALWNDIVEAFAGNLAGWYDELIDELVGAL